MITLKDQLRILPKPELMALFREQGIFQICILNPFYELTTEEFHGLVTHVRMDQCRIMLPHHFLFFVSRNTDSRRIYKGEVSAVVRPEDDITRIFHQCPIPILVLSQHLLRPLALGDVLHECQDMHQAIIGFNNRGRDIQNTLAPIGAGNLPFLGTNILTLPHSLHVLNCLGLQLRVGVYSLMPTQAVDFLHGVTRDFAHAVIPDGKLDEWVLRGFMTDAETFGNLIYNGITKQVFLTQRFHCPLALGDVSENALENFCSIPFNKAPRNIDRDDRSIFPQYGYIIDIA